MAQQDQSDREWHLDKRVPVAFIFALICQGVVATVGATMMYKDIEANRLAIEVITAQVTVLNRDAVMHAIQLGRIDENLISLKADVNRLLTLAERREVD